MAHTESSGSRRELITEKKVCLNRNDPFASKSCGASTTVIVIAIAIIVLLGLIVLTCAGS